MSKMELKDKAIEALKCVIDPHTGISVYEMSLISNLEANNGIVSLKFMPTSPYCPMGIQLAMNIKATLKQLDGVKKVKVTIVGHVQAKEINEMLAKD